MPGTLEPRRGASIASDDVFRALGAASTPSDVDEGDPAWRNLSLRVRTLLAPVLAAGKCCSGPLRARPGPVGLEGGRECLDFGMARCPAPYGGEDLSPGTIVEPVCYHVVTVTGT